MIGVSSWNISTGTRMHLCHTPSHSSRMGRVFGGVGMYRQILSADRHLACGMELVLRRCGAGLPLFKNELWGHFLGSLFQFMRANLRFMRAYSRIVSSPQAKMLSSIKVALKRLKNEVILWEQNMDLKLWGQNEGNNRLWGQNEGKWGCPHKWGQSGKPELM